MINSIKIAVDNANSGKATIFGYYVEDPERFGVMEFDQDWNILSVEEKPDAEDTDYWALDHGLASVTPLCLDMTYRPYFKNLESLQK